MNSPSEMESMHDDSKPSDEYDEMEDMSNDRKRSYDENQYSGADYQEEEDGVEQSTKKRKTSAASAFLHGSRTLVLSGSSSSVTTKFLASKMPNPDGVLKYIFMKDAVVIEFLDTHYALMFLYLYYDTGIQCEDGSVLTVEFSDNQIDGITVSMPNHQSKSSLLGQSGKVLFCLIYDTFPVENFEKHGKILKLIKLPELERAKRVIMEYETETDSNNAYEKLKNHQSLKLYKSKITYLVNNEDEQHPSTTKVPEVPTRGSSASINDKISLVLQVTGFTSNRVNCDVMFILFGVYGDVIRTKIQFSTPKPCAYVQFKDIDGVQRAIKYLGKTGTPCPIYNDYIDVSYAQITEIDESEPLEEGDEIKSYLSSPLHRFTRGSATGRLKNIEHVYPPNKVLCISNININSQNTILETELARYNLKPENIKFFGHKQKLNTKMGLITFSSLNDAVTALVECHDIKIDNFHININFADQNNGVRPPFINQGNGEMTHQYMHKPMGNFAYNNSPHMMKFNPTPFFVPRGRGGIRGGFRGRGRGTYNNYNSYPKQVPDNTRQ